MRRVFFQALLAILSAPVVVLLACGESAADRAPAPPSVAPGLRGWERFELTLDATPIVVPRVSTPRGALVGQIGLGYSGQPSISPDGRWVAHVGEAVMVRDVTARTVTRLRLPDGLSPSGFELLDGEHAVITGHGEAGNVIAVLDVPSWTVRGAYRQSRETSIRCAALAASAAHAFCVVAAPFDIDRGAPDASAGYVLVLDPDGAARVRPVDTSYAGQTAAAHGERVAFYRSVDDAAVVVVSDGAGEPRTFRSSSSVTSLDFSPDGSLLAVGTFGSDLTSYRVARGARVRRLEPTGTELHGALVLDDGTLVRWNGGVEVWAPGSTGRWLPTPCGDLGAAAIVGGTLIHASNVGVCALDLATGALDVSRTAVTPSGQVALVGTEVFVLTTGFDRADRPAPQVLRYDLTTGALVERVDGSGPALRAFGLRDAEDAAWRARLPTVLSSGYVSVASAGQLDPDRRLWILDGAGRTVADLDPGTVVGIGASGVMVSRLDRAATHRVHPSPGAPGRLLDVERPPSYAEIYVTPDGAHAALVGEREVAVVALGDGASTARVARESELAAMRRDELLVVTSSCPAEGNCVERLERLSIPALTPIGPPIPLESRPSAIAVDGALVLVYGASRTQLLVLDSRPGPR